MSCSPERTWTRSGSTRFTSSNTKATYGRSGWSIFTQAYSATAFASIEFRFSKALSTPPEVVRAPGFVRHRPGKSGEWWTSALAKEGQAIVSARDMGWGLRRRTSSGCLFTPFFTSKPVDVRTGLRLSICHGIVTAIAMDRRIKLSSKVSKDTTFHVFMPVAGESTQASAEMKPA